MLYLNFIYYQNYFTVHWQVKIIFVASLRPIDNLAFLLIAQASWILILQVTVENLEIVNPHFFILKWKQLGPTQWEVLRFWSDYVKSQQTSIHQRKGAIFAGEKLSNECS